MLRSSKWRTKWETLNKPSIIKTQVDRQNITTTPVYKKKKKEKPLRNTIHTDCRETHTGRQTDSTSRPWTVDISGANIGLVLRAKRWPRRAGDQDSILGWETACHIYTFGCMLTHERQWAFLWMNKCAIGYTIKHFISQHFISALASYQVEARFNDVTPRLNYPEETAGQDEIKIRNYRLRSRQWP
jgi:hypothetical protein